MVDASRFSADDPANNRLRSSEVDSSAIRTDLVAKFKGFNQPEQRTPIEPVVKNGHSGQRDVYIKD